MPARNYASTRYSSLSQITTQNAAQLKMAWSFSTGVTRGHEAAPLVVDNTMYIVTPFPNVIYALDLTKPGTPLKWKYEPKPLGAAQGVACCDVVNRGASYEDGKIVYMAVPRLAEPDPFFLLDPDHLADPPRTAASITAVSCGTPTPVTTRVVQIDPAPMPTFTVSAPAS